MEAERWQVAVERILAVMECTDAQKVRLASFLLQGEAGIWWQTMEQAYPTVREETWMQFKTRFDEQYFPAHVKDQLANQFVDLKQGSMTIAQYGSKFRELSRYAPGYAATERDKVRKFSDDLCPTIMENIINLGSRTVVEACEKAEVAERTKKIVQTARSQHQVNRNQGPPLKKPRTKGRQPNALCPHCGKTHSGQCWKTMNVCYQCGDPNHRRKDCPKAKQYNQPCPPPPQQQAHPPLLQQQNQWRENHNRV
ncbi:uncharacterized protein LOC143891047 [Tasmannia lanceolata]|uniref:uncharacterized protein LOC143891047 n=1 Tax=Tasmannia lanceolata TaxID=3420 RepID=UPI004063A903